MWGRNSPLYGSRGESGSVAFRQGKLGRGLAVKAWDEGLGEQWIGMAVEASWG